MDKKEINMNNEDMKKFYEGKPVEMGVTYPLYTKKQFNEWMKFITKEKYEKIILPNFSVVVAGPKDLKKDLVCHSYLSYIINRYEGDKYCVFTQADKQITYTWFQKEIYDSKKTEAVKCFLNAYKNYEFIRVRDAFKTYEGFMKFIGQEPKK